MKFSNLDNLTRTRDFLNLVPILLNLGTFWGKPLWIFIIFQVTMILMITKLGNQSYMTLNPNYENLEL